MLSSGAFAVYLEPWHADIFEFLDLRKNHGKVKKKVHMLVGLPSIYWFFLTDHFFLLEAVVGMLSYD